MTESTKHKSLRWTAITLLIVFGVALIGCGLLAPAHFRAVDASVIAAAGQRTTTLVDRGISLLNAGRIGLARVFLAAARHCEMPDLGGLERVLAQAAAWQSNHTSVSELDLILRNDEWALKWDGTPVMEIFASRAARQKVRRHLDQAYRSGVLEILKTRDLTNLVYFSAADTPAGAPYEAAALLSALLVHGERVPEGLQESIEALAYGATRKGERQPLELFYLDLVSLGTRLNWGQLIELMNTVSGLDTLKSMANLARHKEGEWEVLFAASNLHGNAAAVTDYVMNHAKTGMADLRFALRHGEGALRRLLASQEPIFYNPVREGFIAYDPFYSIHAAWLRIGVQSTGLLLLLKYGLILLGVVFLSRAGIDLMPVPEGLHIKRWFSPAHNAFGGGMLILIIALCEPSLFKHNQTLDFPLHWKFPMVAENIQAIIENELKPMLDTLTIAALVFFLVVQGIVYVICLLKLAEIRRQSVPNKVKLKLLENEENMFDAGLYIGLGGTVLSLVMLAMKVVQPSLMAAYASTLFGIIFVALLKICHLRPFRRKLILDIENQPT